ncbi:MAG: TolC family protein [Schlesneria sp.]
MFPINCYFCWMTPILLVAFVTASHGDETDALKSDEDTSIAETSLESAIDLAQSVSPNLAKAAADVEAARGKAVQAGLYPNPIAQGGATQAAGNESQYYFGLSQEIVTKHKLKLNQAAATRETYQAELMFVRTRFELLTAVRQTFFATLAAQRKVEVLTRLVEIARKSAEAAEQLLAAGETSRADLLLFEIELEKSEVALQNTESQLAATRKQLAAAIGIRNMKIEHLTGSLKVSPADSIAQLLNDAYVPYNADIQIAEQEIERSRLVLRRAQVEPFPNVTVYGGYQYQVVPIHDMGLFSASIPVPVWNRNQGNIASAHAQITKATANVSQVQNQIAGRMAELIGRYQIADQQVKRFEERIIPKAREGVTITQAAFAQGTLDSFRLLQSQRGLIDSNLGYITALEMRWLAAAELAGLAQLESFP